MTTTDPNVPATLAAVPTTWDEIIQGVTLFVNAATPLAELADPALIPAITIGSKLLTGVMEAEPSAVALWGQFKADTPPTQAELTQWAADYESAYTDLRADLATALAALPPGA